MVIVTEGIATVEEIVTEISVIEIEIETGIAAVATTKTLEATTKDQWSGIDTTGMVAVAVRTMIG